MVKNKNHSEQRCIQTGKPSNINIHWPTGPEFLARPSTLLPVEGRARLTPLPSFAASEL